MELSEQERAALRAYWLGNPQEGPLAAALAAVPASAEQRQWQAAARAFLREVSCGEIQQARRCLLRCSLSAALVLAEQLRSADAKEAQRAAMDLLRHFEKVAADELAEVAHEAAGEERALLDGLSDEQMRRILAILAEARVAPSPARGAGTLSLKGEG